MVKCLLKKCRTFAQLEKRNILIKSNPFNSQTFRTFNDKTAKTNKFQKLYKITLNYI